MSRDGVSWTRATLAVVAASALTAVGVLTLSGPGDGATVTSAARGRSTAGESASAAAPVTIAPTTTTPPPAIPVNPRGISGWGTAQPNAMAATVFRGTSNTRLTPEQRQLLADQLVRARKAALSIGTVAGALRAGYVKNFQYVDGRGYEYIKWSNFKPYLDLDHPTMLNFPSDSPDARVASVAFQVLGSKEAGPPTDLPLEAIPWHFHSNLCRKGDSIVGNIETAPDGTLYQRQIERCRNLGAVAQPWLNHWMVDLWVIPGWENPWGLVSSKHPDLMRTPVPWFTDTHVQGPDINAPAPGSHH